MSRVLLFIAVSVSVAAPIHGAELFSEPPSAEVADGRTIIRFAVGRPTDAEVAIVDANGAIVRHLAAGCLGDDSKEPFRPGLRQDIAWDGRDDQGLPVRDNALRVRVALGLTGRFERIIGWSGQNLDGVRGLTCGPDGTLFVVYGGGLYAHRQTTLITAFDRDGRYLRQVFPGPAGLPAPQRAGWPQVILDDGREVPVVFHLLSRCVYPGAVFGNRVLPATTSDGRLVMLSGAAEGSTIKHPDMRDGRRLLILGADGSVPADFLGPLVADDSLGGFGQVAISPDNRFAYVAGLFEPGKTGRGLCQVVWRVVMDGSQPAEVFAGQMFQSGAGPNALNDPQGLAVDREGNVYVADYGNHRIAVFDPEGELLNELTVEYPDSVRVHRTTGAVYVMTLAPRPKPISDQHYYAASHNWKPAQVLKFNSRRATTPTSALDMPITGRYGGGAFLALDDSAEQARLWIGGIIYQSGPVFQIRDLGDRMEVAGKAIDAWIGTDEKPLPFVGDVAVSQGRVIVRHPTFRGILSPESRVFDAATGTPLDDFLPRTAEGKTENYWNLVYGEMTSGKDGRLYVHADTTLLRYEPDGRPATFSGLGSHIIDGLNFDRHTHQASVFATARGDIFLAARLIGQGQAADEDVLTIKKIASDGRVAEEELIRVQAARLGGLAVDSRGNVYVGAQVAVADQRVPPWFLDRLPLDSPHGHPGNAYAQYGSILRFAPQGGAVTIAEQGAYIAHRQKVSRVVLDGQLIARGGLVPGKYDRLGLGCACEVSRFDVDAFDRLYVPNVFRFCVLVLDRNGHEITRFGSYGNMDSRGPDSPVPQPEIAFGWPLTARCGDGRVLVADLVNCRVVAVRMEHQAVAECEIGR